MEMIMQPWPWYIAGPSIALIMFLLIYFGESFGFSSNLRTMCTITGAGKFVDFFRFDWKEQIWNLVFVLGSVIGGFLAANYLSNGTAIQLNPDTIEALAGLGFQNAGSEFLPEAIFGTEAIGTLKGVIILIGGGFLVGFGARYAGGCTSGHAISGLSDLQVPSLIAVIGFFIGGLLMSHFLIPLIF